MHSKSIVRAGLVCVAVVSQLGIATQQGMAAAPLQTQVADREARASVQDAATPKQPAQPAQPSANKFVYLPLVIGGTGKAPATLQYQVGKSYLYDYKSVINGQSNSNGTEGAQARNNVLTTTMTAKLTPIQLETDGSWLMELRVENPKFIYQDETGTIQNRSDPDMERDLVRPAYFDQFTSGKVGNIKYDPLDAHESVNLKRGLISELQTQIGKAGKFSASEKDVTGSYSAAYNVASLADTQVISRARTQDDYAPAPLSSELDTNAIINDKSVTFFDAKQGIITGTSSSTLVAATDDSVAPASPGDSGVITDTNGVQTSDGITQSYGSRITSQSLAQSSLTLSNVQAADPAPLPAANYVSDDLIATPPPVITPSVNLSQSLVALSADPGNPTTLQSMVGAINYRPAESLAALRGILRDQQNNVAVMQTVMGALASVGSDETQNALIDEIVLNPASSASNKVAALGNLSAVRKPSARLLSVLQQAMTDTSPEVRPQVALVWGAMASKLARQQPDAAKAIVTSLENELAAPDTAGQPDRIEYLLGALGNAGNGVALPTISRYLSHESSFVRVAAVDALRKMPAKANDLLVQAMSDKNPAVRDAAFSALNQRSPDKTLNRWAYWYWYRTFGGGDFYATLYTYVRAEDNPLYGMAYGQAGAGVFGHYVNVLQAQALTDLVNSTTRRFAAYVWLLGNKIVDRQITVTCGSSNSQRLVGYSLTFFSFDKTFFVGPVPVNLRAYATGNFAVDISYAWNACNAPVNQDVSVTITPRVWLHVSGYAGVNLLLVRGGIGVSVNLLNTALPVTARAIARNTSPAFTGCLVIQAALQPANGSLFLWYQTWALRWPPWDSGWGSEHDLTLWSFGSATYNWTIVNKCFDVN